MKTFRIKPGIVLSSAVWVLEEKHGFKWKEVYKYGTLDVVEKMKDHLLQEAKIYTEKNKGEKEIQRTKVKRNEI